MDQPSESPLTPLGQQLAREYFEMKERRLQPPLRTAAPWLVLALLIGPFFFVDLCLGSIGAWNGQLANQGGVFFFCVSMTLAVCLGNIPAQSVILGCYAVFSPDRGWLRFLVWLGASALLSVVGLLGIYLGMLSVDDYIGDRERDNAIRYFCALPTIALAAQLPLWFFRVLGNWQMKPLPAAAGEREAERRPLSIQHLLAATTVVAVALGSLRLAPLESLYNTTDYWIGVTVFSGIALVASLLGLWLNWLFTRVRNPLYRWSLAVGLPLMLGVFAFSCLVWGQSWEQINGEPLFLFAVFTMLGLSFIFSVFGGVRLLRILGWTIGPVPRNQSS